jgi:AcrR family transcriptional regulator
VSTGTESGRAAGADPARERIAVAMIELVGDQGLERTTVAMVCTRARVDRGAFNRNFSYAGPRGWHDQIWAAAWAAMRFLQEDGLRARFFVVEVNGAGTRAQARRDRILQGLANMIDAGRAQLEDPGSVSRSTAEMVTGSIYGTILTKVRAGAIERGEEFLAELVYMAMMPYLGARAAEDELLVQPLH